MLYHIDLRMRDLTLRVFWWAVHPPKPLHLHEWYHIMAFIRQPIYSSLHQDMSQELELGPWVVASKNTQVLPSNPRRRGTSVASFSSAGSHNGDIRASRSSQPLVCDWESLKRKKMRQKGEEEITC
ncbi:hypothetical protein F5Y03DRAFT_343919 [Xylaria venustula]|nr:hypothetical protein F5Y03DRAFT_343919 [Xylaria venustula]